MLYVKEVWLETRLLSKEGLGKLLKSNMPNSKPVLMLVMDAYLF